MYEIREVYIGGGGVSRGEWLAATISELQTISSALEMGWEEFSLTCQLQTYSGVWNITLHEEVVDGEVYEECVEIRRRNV